MVLFTLLTTILSRVVWLYFAQAHFFNQTSDDSTHHKREDEDLFLGVDTTVVELDGPHVETDRFLVRKRTKSIVHNAISFNAQRVT